MVQILGFRVCGLGFRVCLVGAIVVHHQQPDVNYIQVLEKVDFP